MFITFIILFQIVFGNYAFDKDMGNPLYLTPYIVSNNIDQAKKLAKVNLSTDRNIQSYSGFFTVNLTYNSNLFHWYFVAEEHPETAPLLLWLNGGPDSSSLIGLFQEIGPYQIVHNNLTLREIYWTKNHHVIFLECPVGTGFSYTKNDLGYSNNTAQISNDIYEFITQFFELFPHLKQNNFYVTGESYAGKYILSLSNKIIELGTIKNFKGISIGDGNIDPITQTVGYGNYLYTQGFIDENQLEDFKAQEDKCTQSFQNNKTAYYVYKNCFSIINPATPKTSDSLFKKYTGYTYVYNILKSREPPNSHNHDTYLEQLDIRKAIHVGNITRHRMSATSPVLKHLMLDLGNSELNNMQNLIKSSYKILIYHGQLDTILPYRQMTDYLKKLKFQEYNALKNSKRIIWYVDNEVAGYIKSIGTFNEVMVIGAGHMVPKDQPKRAWNLISKFTSDDI